MNIIETNLSFGSMSVRSKTTRIILHHAAAKSCGAATIHQWHLNNGWAGIGYHFVVRKNGTIERGRPENTVGAHASGSNSDSIGICFEGDFTSEKMSDAQKNAGKELVAYLKKKYGISKVQKHSDVCSTDCPGKNFPFTEIAGATTTSGASKPAASTSKPTATKYKQIKVDKWWGTDTTRLLQQIFGTPVDGKVSNQDPAQKKYLLRADSGAWDFKGTGNGSDLIGAMQRYVGEKDDGFMGKKTIMAWQKFLGVKVDGYMGEDTVGALQRWANKQAA